MAGDAAAHPEYPNIRDRHTAFHAETVALVGTAPTKAYVTAWLARAVALSQHINTWATRIDGLPQEGLVTLR